MDVPVNVVFGNGLGDSLGSLNVDIFVGEVPTGGSQSKIDNPRIAEEPT